MTAQILVVDDEAAIRDMVRMSMELEGYVVFDASNSHQAQSILDQENIDIMILDWMMPGISGVDFASKIRRQERYDIGIIMLTAKSQEDDLLRGLDSGADDFISKPFSVKVLNSRVKALLRRLSSSTVQSDIISAGLIEIDLDQHRVNINKKMVNFSPTEFKLLSFFMSHPERAFNREQLLDNVWGDLVYVEDRTVDVHIRRLRKILQQHQCDHYINTVRGVGYRFSVRAGE